MLRLTVEGSPRVALRLSVPVDEGPTEGGAAHVLQLLALERARAAAAAVGARVDATRTPWGVAYTVEGAAADFDHLAYVLREAAAEPEPDGVAFERARARALSEAQRLRETATGRMLSVLRERVAPTHRLVEGSPATVEALGPAVLRGVWSRSHRRDRMTLVVVGDIPPELMLASFQDMGASGAAAAAAPSAPAPPGGGTRLEVLRTWYGEARDIGELRDARGLVAAALVSDRLAALTRGRIETRLEVWEVGDRRMMGVIGAAYPGEAAGLQALIRGVVGETVGTADAARVADAVERVRSSLLMSARTPGGMAGLVGRYHDATGDPAGAAVLLESLDGLGAPELQAFLRAIAEATPVRAEVRP